MTRQRLSSWTTIWLAWIMPLIFLPLWSVLTVIMLYSYFDPGAILFIAVSTIMLWVFYLTTKPWQLKYIYKGDDDILFKDKGMTHLISFRHITRIYPSFFTKYSPIVIEYKDNGTNKKISFIPRQSKVIFLLPFFKHPMTKELLDEIKTGANSA